MRILLYMGNGGVVNSAGGAEKVLCNIANEMTERGHEVTILCDDMESGKPFYPLHDQVKFININGTGKKIAGITVPQYLKIIREVTRPIRKTFLAPWFPDPVGMLVHPVKAIRVQFVIEQIKPDVIIPFFIDDMYLLSLIKELDVPTILMIHGSPHVSLHDGLRKEKKSLTKCHCVQVLLPGYVKSIDKEFPGIKTVVIPNTVPQVGNHETADLCRIKDNYRITMLARLDKDKQQHLLIKAFAAIANDYPQWQVDLYGNEYTVGYEVKLKQLIRHLHLEHRVFLRGATEKPLDAMKESDIFAFPSRYEGFPLALTEAMSVGLPCVGLKSASAVNELIVDDDNGLLAENNEADFAAKLKLLMDDRELRIRLGANGREFVKQFAPQPIWDQWEKLLYETTGHPFPQPQLQIEQKAA